MAELRRWSMPVIDQQWWRRSRVRMLLVGGNVLAIPLYSMAFSAAVVDHLQAAWRFSPYADVAGGIVMAGIAIAAWCHSARVGATTQIIFLFPIVLALFFGTHSNWSGFEPAALRDWRVLLGIALIVVIPGALLAGAILVIGKARKSVRNRG